MAEAAAEISLNAEDVLGTPPDPDTIVRTPAHKHAADAGADNVDDWAERGPQNWPWIVAAVRHIDRGLPGLSTWSIGRLLRDVYVYITDKTVQQKIDEVVEAALGPGPTLVVSHSLGTVVAYNVLRKKQWNVSGLITLGSPLGIHAIRQRLEPPSITRPDVGPWTNLYDEQDIVALNPLNTAQFAVFDQPILDVQVDNDSENHHNIRPYMSHSSTAKHIHAILAKEVDK
jgi:pimeloyl-ACP methyl ester carboxylesterase